ncbi:hypothetical protein BDZ91DRAFT_762885 [Kalaharituber pfeilii]|nr:hypothetical protein BDZ91DRAFT_762885 [Kalaharituber pfeilii]
MRLLLVSLVGLTTLAFLVHFPSPAHASRCTATTQPRCRPTNVMYHVQEGGKLKAAPLFGIVTGPRPTSTASPTDTTNADAVQGSGKTKTVTQAEEGRPQPTREAQELVVLTGKASVKAYSPTATMTVKIGTEFDLLSQRNRPINPRDPGSDRQRKRQESTDLTPLPAVFTENSLISNNTVSIFPQTVGAFKRHHRPQIYHDGGERKEWQTDITGRKNLPMITRASRIKTILKASSFSLPTFGTIGDNFNGKPEDYEEIFNLCCNRPDEQCAGFRELTNFSFCYNPDTFEFQLNDGTMGSLLTRRLKYLNGTDGKLENLEHDYNFIFPGPTTEQPTSPTSTITSGSTIITSTLLTSSLPPVTIQNTTSSSSTPDEQQNVTRSPTTTQRLIKTTTVTVIREPMPTESTSAAAASSSRTGFKKLMASVAATCIALLVLLSPATGSETLSRSDEVSAQSTHVSVDEPSPQETHRRKRDPSSAAATAAASTGLYARPSPPSFGVDTDPGSNMIPCPTIPGPSKSHNKPSLRSILKRFRRDRPSPPRPATVELDSDYNLSTNSSEHIASLALWHPASDDEELSKFYAKRCHLCGHIMPNWGHWEEVHPENLELDYVDEQGTEMVEPGKRLEYVVMEGWEGWVKVDDDDEEEEEEEEESEDQVDPKGKKPHVLKSFGLGGGTEAGVKL